MVVLVRATSGVAGVPSGFPILVDRAMRIVEPAFAYLIEIAIIPGRSHSVETVRTYAEHLHDWFDTLEQSGLDWRNVGEPVVAAYRNRMLEQPSQHTGRPYARATVNARVHTVCRFYAWAQRRGLIAHLPFGLIEVWAPGARHQHAAPHLVLEGGLKTWANILTVPEQGRIPRPLRAAELARLLSVLGQPYRLMAEWAVTTGLRRMELCALTLKHLPPVHDPGRDPLIPVEITQTKGDRPRTVYAPVRLADRTQWYVGEERVAAMRRRGRSAGSRPTALFLRPSGEPLTHASTSAVFGRAFDAAGLQGSLHLLRHTFAVTMLAALQRRLRVDPDLNPLKVLQVLMGHSSIETTALYLRCVELHAESLEESVGHLYGALVPDVP